MALRKMRNNIDRLFDKNLTDLIRGIRNNKENEARYIAACIEEIKLELRQDSTFIKANAIEKLAYLQMLGYDISWASFNIIEVMASTKYSEKRIGYLAATQSFNDDTDVLMLTTNLIRKDLQSSNLYDVGVALSGLACFATSDLSRDLVSDVVNLLSSSRPYVRKKAVLLLYKIFLKYPESLRPTFPRLRDKLEDPDPGVQSAAVNVICELARKNPRNYLSLHEVFFRLMNTSSNNWMLIKIIKLFGSLVPLESKIGKKLLEPLTNLINSTSAMSLLYECINTVIAVLISISAEGPGDYSPSIQLCVQKLGVLIEDSDQNLKYLGLLAMGKILLTHPKAVQAHKDIVLRCLDDKDESIRLRALDLLYSMVSKKNIMEIVKKLMEHVDAAEGSFYRDELLSRIISICSHNNYQYITNFEWYISVLVEMTKVEGSKHGVLIAEQIQDVTVRVQSIRHFSVSQMALLVENAHLLLAGNNVQRNNICAVLLAAAWICGEYAEHLNNISSVLESMLRIKISIVPGELLSVYAQNIAKLYSVLLVKYEADDDWDSVESLDHLMLSKLPDFQFTDHLEAQQRACNLMELVKFVEKEHQRREKLGNDVARLFDGELNPVAVKAQRRVPVPEGLDLNAWIHEPEPDSEDESSASSDDDLIGSGVFPTIKHRQAFENDQKPYANGSSQQQRSNAVSSHHRPKSAESAAKKQRVEEEMEENRRRRKFEQENNPYYMKADKRLSAVSSAADSNHQLAKMANGWPSSSAASLSSLAATGRRSNNNCGGDETTPVLPSSTSAELQSPLEIPGVIGMDQYMRQQESTLSWKNAVKLDKRSAKKGKKTKKNGEKEGGGKATKRNQRGAANLSVLSSSDEGNSSGVVVHYVNRDDGEMPEDALSSQDEAEKSLENEFRALDMNLDAPLREDEQLFVIKPYAPPASAAYVNEHRLPIADRNQSLDKTMSNGSTNQKKIAKKIVDAGETKAKKKRKKDAEKEGDVKSKKKSLKSTKKRLEKKSASNEEPDPTTTAAYTSIAASAAGEDRGGSTSKRKSGGGGGAEQSIIEIGESSSFANNNAACFSGSTEVTGKTSKRKLKQTLSKLSLSSLPFKTLAENEHLLLDYHMKPVENADAHRLEVVLAFTNKTTASTLRGFKVFMLESATIRLDRGDNSSMGEAVTLDNTRNETDFRLDFDLPTKTRRENSLHFLFGDVTMTQRIRGSVTYLVGRTGEINTHIVDFTLNFPATMFLLFSTIGNTSYELVLSSGELTASAQQQCQTSKTIKEIHDSVCKNSNFSAVVVLDDAVSLYAHDSQRQYVCVLIKQSTRKKSSSDNNSGSGGSASPETPLRCTGAVSTTVSVKCMDAQLATAVANELCDHITEMELSGGI